MEVMVCGGLLSFGSVTAFWRLVKLHLRNVLSKPKGCKKKKKIAMPEADVGPQEGSEFFNGQQPTTFSSIKTSKDEWTGLSSLTLLTFSPILPINYPKNHDTFLLGNMLSQALGCRKCFPGIVWNLKHGFLCFGNKKHFYLIGKHVLNVICPNQVNENKFEYRYNYLI